MVGVFAASSFGGVKMDLDIGHQLTVQLLAVVITAVYSVVASIVLLKIIQFAVGLRVTGVAEQQGLDLTEHEESGYSHWRAGQPTHLCRSSSLGEGQNESYPPLASLDPPGGRVKSLSLWESRPERPERGCITRVVYSLPLALGPR